MDTYVQELLDCHSSQHWKAFNMGGNSRMAGIRTHSTISYIWLYGGKRVISEHRIMMY